MAQPSSSIEDIDHKQLAALIGRVEEAIEHGLALSADDLLLLLNAIQTLATVQEKLESKDVTLLKLKKLLGMVTSSEKRNRNAGSNRSNKKGASPRKPRTKQPATREERHMHDSMKKGDPCPELGCEKGKIYPTRPKTFIRVSAHAPYEATKHLLETLRCNLCGTEFTAKPSDAVLKDGDVNQEYGYSARSLMSINKFFSGQGYHHQDNLSDLMGHRISASTNFDQCEHLSNDVMPVFYQLMKEAAHANLLLGDDTSHRILNQEPEERPNRNGKGKRLRTGIYSSCLIAKTEQDNEIVLFETSLGHLGEFIDKIMRYRPPEYSPPQLMSDALSSNNSTIVDLIKALCNSHSRRQFADIEDRYPEVSSILDLYGKVWENDGDTKDKSMTDHERLQYHKENSLPIMKAIKDWCELRINSAEFEENGALASAIKYFNKHYEGLTQFCKIPGAPIDNNRTEETLKIVIRGRKSYSFFKTANGAGVANVITSLIATAWRTDINVYRYLTDLQRYKDLVKSNPEKWVPYRYENTLKDMNEIKEAA